MRWCTVRVQGQTAAGLVHDEHVYTRHEPNLLSLLETEPDLSSFIPETLAHPADRIPFEMVTYAAPVPRPPSIRDFMAYEEHPTNIRRALGLTLPAEWYEYPAFYFTNPGSSQGPDEPVRRTPGSRQFDMEIELAAVIGRKGRDISAAEAADHIAGFMLMCDWSARDIQQKERTLGLGLSKAKDSAMTFGPWLLTPDELPGWSGTGRPDVEVTASINGRTVTTSSFEPMHWTFAQMIAHASLGADLHPGDVIGSGTVGRGCIWELRSLPDTKGTAWLEPGDIVRIAAPGLGRIGVEITPPSFEPADGV